MYEQSVDCLHQLICQLLLKAGPSVDCMDHSVGSASPAQLGGPGHVAFWNTHACWLPGTRALDELAELQRSDLVRALVRQCCTTGCIFQRCMRICMHACMRSMHMCRAARSVTLYLHPFYEPSRSQPDEWSIKYSATALAQCPWWCGVQSPDYGVWCMCTPPHTPAC